MVLQSATPPKRRSISMTPPRDGSSRRSSRSRSKSRSRSRRRSRSPSTSRSRSRRDSRSVSRHLQRAGKPKGRGRGKGSVKGNPNRGRPSCKSRSRSVSRRSRSSFLNNNNSRNNIGGSKSRSLSPNSRLRKLKSSSEFRDLKKKCSRSRNNSRSRSRSRSRSKSARARSTPRKPKSRSRSSPRRRSRSSKKSPSIVRPPKTFPNPNKVKDSKGKARGKGRRSRSRSNRSKRSDRSKRSSVKGGKGRDRGRGKGDRRSKSRSIGRAKSKVKLIPAWWKTIRKNNPATPSHHKKSNDSAVSGEKRSRSRNSKRSRRSLSRHGRKTVLSPVRRGTITLRANERAQKILASKGAPQPERYVGIIKSYHRRNQWGFIVCKDFDKDIFVKESYITKRVGEHNFKQVPFPSRPFGRLPVIYDHVSFEIKEDLDDKGRKKYSARNISFKLNCDKISIKRLEKERDRFALKKSKKADTPIKRKRGTPKRAAPRRQQNSRRSPPRQHGGSNPIAAGLAAGLAGVRPASDKRSRSTENNNLDNKRRRNDNNSDYRRNNDRISDRKRTPIREKRATTVEDLEGHVGLLHRAVRGVVDDFSEQLSYGFVDVTNIGRIFVHRNALEFDGDRNLRKGDKVQLDIERERNGRLAGKKVYALDRAGKPIKFRIRGEEARPSSYSPERPQSKPIDDSLSSIDADIQNIDALSEASQSRCHSPTCIRLDNDDDSVVSADDLQSEDGGDDQDQDKRPPSEYAVSDTEDEVDYETPGDSKSNPEVGEKVAEDSLSATASPPPSVAAQEEVQEAELSATEAPEPDEDHCSATEVLPSPPVKPAEPLAEEFMSAAEEESEKSKTPPKPLSTEEQTRQVLAEAALLTADTPAKEVVTETPATQLTESNVTQHTEITNPPAEAAAEGDDDSDDESWCKSSVPDLDGCI